MFDHQSKNLLPPMLLGEELRNALEYLPAYRESFRQMDPGQRLLKLKDIYKVFVPQSMAEEIYHKIYLMAAMGLEQKNTPEAIICMNQNHQMKVNGSYHGVITGASSSTLIGDSGIGKTSCLQRAMEILGGVMETRIPLNKIIPVVLVTCPYDSNQKGLLYQIVIMIDQFLGTEYYAQVTKYRYNTQQLMSLVSQLCQHHICVLIIDEIQFLVEGHQSGTQLYRMILQLINAAGITVLMVGTNECLDYFSQAPQMARRSTGLQYGNLDFGKEFRKLAETLFQYQYVRTPAQMTEGLLYWLYEHTAGNPGNLMALLHDSQEIAILKGTEKIDVSTLTEAYSNRMQMLHMHISANKKRLPQTSKRKRVSCSIESGYHECMEENYKSVIQLADEAKRQGTDVAAYFRQSFPVEEVTA